MSHCIVITTCSSREEANALAHLILHAKLAACIQLSDIESRAPLETLYGSQRAKEANLMLLLPSRRALQPKRYSALDKIHNDPEVKLLIKTLTSLYEPLQALIMKEHRYDVPEIIMISIDQGHFDYLDWISDATR